MDDREAIRRIKKGDIGGLEVLVHRHQVRAVRAAFLVTHDEALAEDIVQETSALLNLDPCQASSMPGLDCEIFSGGWYILFHPVYPSGSPKNRRA